MKRRLAFILLTALASIFGTLACGGGEGEGGGGGEETTSAQASGGETTAGTTGEETAITSTEVARTTVELTPSSNSGVTGTATLIETAGEVVTVDLELRNLLDDPGAAYPAYIQAGGTCADERAGNSAPVEFPLDPVIVQQTEETTGKDVTASSTSALDGLSLGHFLSGPPQYINVYALGDEVPPGIACGDLSRTGGGETTAGGGTTGQ
jgi:hypothetical protein